MPVPIEGKYVLVKSENFDEYLKVCGVSYFIRTVMQNATPTIEIYKDEEDYWIIKTVITFKTITHRFKIGEEYETDIPDGSGRRVRGMAIMDGNRIVQTTQTKEGDEFIDSREFTEDGMITTVKHKGVESIRTYQRQ